MATIREIRAKFTAEVRGATQAFRQVRDEAARLGTDTQRATDQANAGFNDVIRTASRLRAALTEAGDDDAFRDLQRAIDRTEDEMQRLGTVSDEAMDDLGRAIRTSGEHLDGLSDDARRSMSNVEGAVNDANDTFRRLGRDTGLDGLRADANNAGNNLQDLENDVQDVDRALDNAEDGLRDFGDTAERESGGAQSSFGGLGKALGGLAGLVAGAFAIDQIKDFGTELAASAGAAKASKAQFTTVFGDMEADAAASLNAIAEEATILPERMKDSFTKIAAFAKTGGMDTADSLDLASRSMRAVADSAAFYDRSLEDTTESLQSYLKGNYENDAALGISSTETTRNAAANKEYGKSFKDLSEAQKQLTLLKMVEDANKVTGALGQASRESTGWENVVGNMAQAWENFKAKIGTPVLDVAVKGLVGMTEALQAIDTEAIAAGIKKGFDIIAGAIKFAKDAITPFVNGIKTAKEVVDGLLFDDGQKGRDLLAKLGFSPEMIAKIDGYAAKFAEFRWYISDIIDGIKGLFKDDGSGGRDILARIGFSPDLITKMDAFAQNFSAFKGNVSNVMSALMKMLNGESGGMDLLLKLGFTPDFILKADGFMQKIRTIGGIVGNVASTMGAAFAKYGPQIMATVQSVLIDLWPKVKVAVGAVVGFVVSNLGKIMAFWQANGPQFMAAVTNVFNGIMAVIKFVMPVVLAIIKSVWGNVKGVITGALDVIMGVVKVFSGLFTGDFKKMWEGLKQIFSGAVTFLWNFIQLTFYGKILGGAKVFFAAFRGGFASLWTGIKALFTGGVGAAWQTIKAGWAQISGATKTVFSGIWNFLKSVFTTIKNLFTSSINFWKSAFSGGFTNLFNATKTGLGKIKSWFGNIFSDIVTAVRGRFSDIVDLAKALPGRIGQGIGNMASSVKSGVTKVINTLATTLGKGVNGVIGGINWVLGKIGVESKVPKWDVPQYAQGTKGNGAHPGGLMVVGDGKGNNKGPELIETPDGKQMLSPNKPTLTTAPKGTKVWSAKVTKEILSMVPHYAFGTESLEAAGNWIKNTWNSGKQKVKEVGGKVKDAAFNAFDYIKKPGGFLDLALKTLGINKPAGGSFVGNMAGGGWDQVKSKAIEFIKEKLKSFGLTNSGISVMGGNGGGFGAPFRLTSKPGPRNTGIPGASTFHKGWDWAAPTGTPIPSVTDGVVSRNSWHPLSGNFVEIRDGSGKVHRYQHNSKNIAQVGQQVKKGQTIALVGATGVGSGSHLHYELKGYENGGIVDGKYGAQLAWLTEGGWSESVISHDPAKRTSQKAIWEETGRELGFMGEGTDEMIALLRRIADGVHSSRDLKVFMDARAVGHLVEPHVSERQKVIEKRNNTFGVKR